MPLTLIGSVAHYTFGVLKGGVWTVVGGITVEGWSSGDARREMLPEIAEVAELMDVPVDEIECMDQYHDEGKAYQTVS